MPALSLAGYVIVVDGWLEVLARVAGHRDLLLGRVVVRNREGAGKACGNVYRLAHGGCGVKVDDFGGTQERERGKDAYALDKVHSRVVFAIEECSRLVGVQGVVLRVPGRPQGGSGRFQDELGAEATLDDRIV